MFTNVLKTKSKFSENVHNCRPSHFKEPIRTAADNKFKVSFLIWGNDLGENIMSDIPCESSASR